MESYNNESPTKTKKKKKTLMKATENGQQRRSYPSTGIVRTLIDRKTFHKINPEMIIEVSRHQPQLLPAVCLPSLPAHARERKQEDLHLPANN